MNANVISGRQVRRFYDVAEAAELLRLSEPTLYRAIRAGEFPAIRVRGRLVIPARAIDDMETSALANGLVDARTYALRPAG
ncbi:helix-turn-helix domain-containing protein [Salinispora cortesiana]|uniref:helix-turn-helix domain-containing protein n=1 Tax=Salinispora cortesiana TaxID=1305843 RepID=UPI0003FF2B04|nr:helix-turn-helix domain-containing protein [Salinispora cortesiana]